MTPRPNARTERRQQILEAAMTCFARKGYHLTTMDDIAAELPFTKAMLYYYFDDKRSLFLSILKNWMDSSIIVWEDILSPQDDAVTNIQRCLEYGITLVSHQKDLTRVEFEFFGELGRDKDVLEAFQNIFGQFRVQIMAILEEGIRRGELRQLDVESVAAIVLGIYEGLAMQSIVDPAILNWPLISETVIDLVMQGIQAKPSLDL